MRRAVGRLDDGGVEVQDAGAANRLYNKGMVGTPQTGNSLRLSLVEASHAVMLDRLVVRDEEEAVGLRELLQRTAEAGSEVDFLVYADLRERGLTVRHHGDAFRVWARGSTLKEDPWFTTTPVTEGSGVDGAWIADQAGNVVSLADEDGAVTHYQVVAVEPGGESAMRDLPVAEGILLADRVLVRDPDAVATLAAAHFGTRRDTALVLSFVEAAWLMDQDALRVEGDLQARAAGRQPDFHATLRVYTALREAGVVAKSGFKFGTHLRGYRGSLDAGHAEWLFHCGDGPMHWSEVARGVRLAHGVRKQFVVASGEEPRFAALQWFRP